MGKKTRLKRRNICVVTTQRSGSTWLMQLLNGTQQVRAYGEVFLEWAHIADHTGDRKLLPPRFFTDYQNESKSRNVSGFLDELEASDDRPIAFKIMYDQIRRRPAILIGPITREYVIVHLTRRNALDVVMSRLLARETRIYHSKTKIDEPIISPDPGLVLSMLKRVDRQITLAKAALAVVPAAKLEICYEDLASRPIVVVSQILNAAGLNDEASQSTGESWIKTNARAAKDVFGNYDKIEHIVSRSKYAWMLEKQDQTSEQAA